MVNDKKNWLMVQAAGKAARWLGLLPFNLVVDERNAPPEIFVPEPQTVLTDLCTGETCEVPQSAAAALPYAYLNGFSGRQLYRIIFYGEKTSLASVLRPIAQRIGAEMILVTGESSDSRIAGMAQRANADGRPAVILYFSDFDPSGHQMPTSVSRSCRRCAISNIPTSILGSIR